MEHQVPAHFGQQGMGGYCPQGQPGYYSQSQQSQQPQHQTPYSQPRHTTQQVKPNTVPSLFSCGSCRAACT
ncbi:uncharacterized [Tachysurus ichikawai]